MIRKIVIVHTDFRLYWPSRLMRLNDFLAERAVELVIVEIAGKGSPYSFDSGSGAVKGLRWLQLFGDRGMEEIDAGEAAGAVIRKLDELDPDAVIAGPIAFPSGAASVRWCARKKRPVVVFDDARLDDVPRPFYVDWIKKQVYGLVDAMVIPAPSHDSTSRYFGFRQERIFYGVNVVDNDFFAFPGISAGAQQENPFPLGPFLLAVGRQVGKKNWKMLLNAFRHADDDPVLAGWSLVFIGDGEEHEELVALAGGETVGRRVHFVPFRTQEELAVYYRFAAALVLPSLYGETWGLVVNEAMAAGLPVLVSRQCGCVATLVRDGENGYVFDPGDQQGVERTLLQFAGLDPVRRIEMGRASKAIIAGWDMERFCRGMWDAVSFAHARGKRSPTLAGRIFISLWNGRYRPT